MSEPKPLWETLKQFKIAALIPSRSKEPEVFKRWVTAARKGVQKEKYKDDAFRVRYPNAVLSSHIHPTDDTKLVFELHLGYSSASVADLGDNNG